MEPVWPFGTGDRLIVFWQHTLEVGLVDFPTSDEVALRLLCLKVIGASTRFMSVWNVNCWAEY